MNKERYPTNFLLVLGVYLIALIFGLNFIIGSVSYGITEQLDYYTDFFYILAIVLLPLVFIALYVLTPRIRVLWGHEHLLRLIISVLTLISIIFVSIFLIPFMV